MVVPNEEFLWTDNSMTRRGVSCRSPILYFATRLSVRTRSRDTPDHYIRLIGRSGGHALNWMPSWCTVLLQQVIHEPCAITSHHFGPANRTLLPATLGPKPLSHIDFKLVSTFGLSALFSPTQLTKSETSVYLLQLELRLKLIRFATLLIRSMRVSETSTDGDRVERN